MREKETEKQSPLINKLPVLSCFIITTELKTRFPVLLTTFIPVQDNDDRNVFLKIVVMTEQVSQGKH